MDVHALGPGFPRRALIALVALHIVVIGASNYLVQFPFEAFGLHTTWGAFTYPFLFVATDLTVRLMGATHARRIVFLTLFPGLAVSYVLTTLFVDGRFVGLTGLLTPGHMILRIVLASFCAYFCGQMLDILVFRRLRELRRWWPAPLAANTFGSAMDTLVFFSIAFAASSDPFMATHWVEIALLDYLVKLIVGVGMFVPLYGALLRWISSQLRRLKAAPLKPLSGVQQSARQDI